MLKEKLSLPVFFFLIWHLYSVLRAYHAQGPPFLFYIFTSPLPSFYLQQPARRRGEDVNGLACSVVCRAVTFPPGYLPLSLLLFCPVKLIDPGISFCLRIHDVHPGHQVPRSRHSLCGYCRAICTICTVAKRYCFPAVSDQCSLLNSLADMLD